MANASRRLTAQHVFFHVNPEGQRLFGVQPGVPIRDALESADMLFDVAQNIINASADRIASETDLYGASFLLEMARSALQGVIKGLYLEGKTATDAPQGAIQQGD